MTGPINGYGAGGQIPINRTLQQAGQGHTQRTPQEAPERAQEAPQQRVISDKSALAKAAFASHISNSNVSEHGQETKETPRGSLLDITV